MTKEEEQFLERYNAASREDKDRMYEELMESVSPEQRRLYESGAKLHIFQTVYRMRQKEWSETHPENLSCASDKYYANLVNRLCEATVLCNLPSHLAIQATFDFACSAVAYLEDLVSETHIWDSIRSLYRKTYGTWLPFYDCEHKDYLLDNVNIEDLKYLAWQTYNRWGQAHERFYSPYGDIVEHTAEIFYDILVDEFEDAPEATRVSDYVKKSLRGDDYFKVRGLAEWLAIDNKLVAPTFLHQWIIEEAEGLKQSKDAPHGVTLDRIIGMLRQNETWLPTGQFGCIASRYLAEMARQMGYDKTAVTLDDLKFIEDGEFKIGGYNQSVLRMTDKAGQTYEIDRRSLRAHNNHMEAIEDGTYSLVRFGDKWHMHGVGSLQREENVMIYFGEADDYTEDAKMSWITDIVTKYNGQRIFYCTDINEVSKILDVTVTDKHKRPAKNYVLMLSDEAGPVVIRNIADCFNDPNNPFFDKKMASDYSLAVITDEIIPDDIAKLMQDQNLLPEAQVVAHQGEDTGRKIIRENLRFLVGFYRTVNPKIKEVGDLSN